MSVVRVETPLLSLSPQVWCEGDHLYARTSLLLQTLGIFSYARTVHVDRAAKYVYIDTRYLWGLRSSTVIPFRKVERLEYRFGSVPTSATIGGHIPDQVERFRVELVLDDGEHVPLFSFRGEGSAMTGAVGVLWGDSIADFSGDQETTSRAYVDLLQQYLGVSLGGVPRLADAAGRTWACRSCERPAPPRPGKCLYCGGELAADR